MHERLRALVRISEIDSSARELDRQLQQIPARIAESKADVARLEALLARERADLAAAERLKQSHGEEIARHNDSLGRARAKSAKARNAREADAVEREVEGARRAIKEREAEREKLSAAIEQQRKTLTEHEGEFAKLRDELAADEREAEAKAETLRAERARVTEGRSVHAALIDKTTLRFYEQIREKRGFGVAEIVGGTCSGCRMALAPQMIIEMQRGEQADIAQCPHCRRFVYLRALLVDALPESD